MDVLQIGAGEYHLGEVIEAEMVSDWYEQGLVRPLAGGKRLYASGFVLLPIGELEFVLVTPAQLARLER